MKHTRPHGAMLALLAFALVLLAWPALAEDIGDQQDKGFIDVEKVFVGITEEQIPDDFAIKITSGETTHTLKIDSSTVTPTDNGVSVVLRLNGVSAGTYLITETDQDIPGYHVESIGLGETQEITAAEMTFGEYIDVKSKDLNDFKLTSDMIFVGSLTASVGDAVVTYSTLNTSERIAVEQMLSGLKNKHSGPYYFFSIEEQLKTGESSFSIQDKTLVYDFDTTNLRFDKSSAWSISGYVIASHTDTETTHADFQVTNTYTKQTLTVSKEVTGNLGSKSRSFDYTVTLPEMANQLVTCRTSDTPGTLELDANGTGHFSLAHGQSITLEAVYGRYTVEEAATGGYTTTISTNGAEAAGQTSISGTIAPGDTQIKFINELEISPPTGVHDSVGYALVGLLLTAALWFITRIGGGYARHE